MKKSQKLLLLVLFVSVLILSGCQKASNLQIIKGIPANAEKVSIVELKGESGTYTSGRINVSGNGHLILDVQLESGSVTSIGTKEALTNKVIYTIKSPKNAIYDGVFYAFEADSEYQLVFTNAKKVKGIIAIYFLAE